jgi:C1A family cysteine protease
MKPDEGFLRKIHASLMILSLLSLCMSLSVTGCSGGGSADSTGGLTASPPPDGGGVIYHHPEELAKVQAAIQQQGAQWIAGETSVSESFEDIQDAQIMAGDEDPDLESPVTALTLKPPVNTVSPQNLKSDQAHRESAASTFSWRNKDNKDWTTAAKDQGHYGTCITFATIGALELQIRIAKNDPAIAINLSEWFLWHEGNPNVNPNPGGWDESAAAKTLKEKGTVTQQICPYTPENYPAFTEIPSSAKRYKINSYSWVTGMDAMKKALEKGPLVGSMTVFPSFDNFYKGGVYSEVFTYDPNIDSYKDKYGKPAKGTLHAILIIGYDDNQGCWICKNSSGPGWGDNGYCLIKYGITGGIVNQALQLSVDSEIDLP